MKFFKINNKILNSYPIYNSWFWEEKEGFIILGIPPEFVLYNDMVTAWKLFNGENSVKNILKTTTNNKLSSKEEEKEIFEVLALLKKKKYINLIFKENCND